MPVTCDSCELLAINGVVCHETGCPNAWRNEIRECSWCGQEFKPERPEQTCCDDTCAESYNG